MIPNSISLAQAGRASAAPLPVSPATVRIIPTVRAAAPAALPIAVPDPRPAASAAAYFGLFRPCDCGHSSAWHSGAFGDAWRAGQQVRGRCEAAVEDGSARGCSCARFNEPGLAS
jgi:hypothetical protein